MNTGSEWIVDYSPLPELRIEIAPTHPTRASAPEECSVHAPIVFKTRKLRSFFRFRSLTGSLQSMPCISVADCFGISQLRVFSPASCAGCWRDFERHENGDPGLIRTADKQFRKLLLYPSELRGHVNSIVLKLRNPQPGVLLSKRQAPSRKFSSNRLNTNAKLR